MKLELGQCRQVLVTSLQGGSESFLHYSFPWGQVPSVSISGLSCTFEIYYWDCQDGLVSSFMYGNCTWRVCKEQAERVGACLFLQ